MHRYFLILVFLWPMISQAQIYKCESDGKTQFSDKPCGPSSQLYSVEDGSATNRATYATPNIKAYADSYKRRQRLEQLERHDAVVSRERAEKQRRSVPGIPGRCPSESAIEDAIRHRIVAQCMTVSEVKRAEPVKYNDHVVRTRLLDSGPMATEWIYPRHKSTWPAVIRFIDGYVVGFENSFTPPVGVFFRKDPLYK